MAGPCSVESADQITATARAVREAAHRFSDGGVFKPRTSPYAFQGLGWDGLELLAAAGRATGMPIISEVMAVDQVRRMAEMVDILQVGTRNMQNFDLLRELGKVDRRSCSNAVSPARSMSGSGRPNTSSRSATSR